VTLLPSGEKVGREAVRMRGMVDLDASIQFATNGPLIRQASPDTFSPEGRRPYARA